MGLEKYTSAPTRAGDCAKPPDAYAGRMKFLQRFWCVALVSMMSMCVQAQSGGGIAFTRAARLKRGINLSMWYAQSSDYSAARLASYTTEEDFKLIKSLGF